MAYRFYCKMLLRIRELAMLGRLNSTKHKSEICVTFLFHCICPIKSRARLKNARKIIVDYHAFGLQHEASVNRVTKIALYNSSLTTIYRNLDFIALVVSLCIEGRTLSYINSDVCLCYKNLITIQDKYNDFCNEKNHITYHEKHNFACKMFV